LGLDNAPAKTGSHASRRRLLRPLKPGGAGHGSTWPTSLHAQDLDLIFTSRELRKVTQNLLLHYERKLYVLVDTADNRRLIGKYVEVFQYRRGWRSPRPRFSKSK